MCENTHFLDLYGGVGLFAISLGSSAKRTTLMELEGRSTTLAAYNKTANQLEHLDIVCGAVEETLPHLSLEPDENVLALIDPPRSGLKPNVIETLHEFRPQRLAYLSCNPETQLRDLAHFRRLGWTIESITPYDFFPRSYHIESLAFLSISNET
jgi:tRNA/tmRNA/rRNA uracil-C5-methylase (TrmA/RlmC/RlmD family)